MKTTTFRYGDKVEFRTVDGWVLATYRRAARVDGWVICTWNGCDLQFKRDEIRKAA